MNSPASRQELYSEVPIFLGRGQLFNLMFYPHFFFIFGIDLMSNKYYIQTHLDTFRYIVADFILSMLIFITLNEEEEEKDNFFFAFKIMKSHQLSIILIAHRLVAHFCVWKHDKCASKMFSRDNNH